MFVKVFFPRQSFTWWGFSVARVRARSLEGRKGESVGSLSLTQSQSPLYSQEKKITGVRTPTINLLSLFWTTQFWLHVPYGGTFVAGGRQTPAVRYNEVGGCFAKVRHIFRAALWTLVRVRLIWIMAAEGRDLSSGKKTAMLWERPPLGVRLETGEKRWKTEMISEKLFIQLSFQWEGTSLKSLLQFES